MVMAAHRFEPKPGYELQSLGFRRSGDEWPMSSSLWARCPRCRDFVNLGPERIERCSCGSLLRDAGRFAWQGGDDDEIELVKFVPAPPRDGEVVTDGDA
jgi:hypothetical protein